MLGPELTHSARAPVSYSSVPVHKFRGGSARSLAREVVRVRLIFFVSRFLLYIYIYIYIIKIGYYAEKCPQDAEDAEVGQLRGSAPPHPIRCPVF